MQTEQITQALLEAVRLLEAQNTKQTAKLDTTPRESQSALAMHEYIGHAIRAHLTAVQGINILDIMKCSELIIKAFERGNKVLICGNGGSAADAQHIAAEFVVKFSKRRAALPAIALNTDTSALTAIGNDFSFNEIFSRQVEAIGNESDILIAISTSGKSPNILKAMEAAANKNMIVIGITGLTGYLLLGRLATGPEVLVADEEVRELGRVLLGEKVLEVGALPRDVVDHEVEHEVALLANAPHVVPGAELLIDDVVAHGGEAAVGRAREEGQDMNAAHGLVEVLVEHLAKVGEVATQAVRVRDEHDLVVELHGLLPCVWWVSRKPRRLGPTSKRSIVPDAAGHDV